MWARFWALCAEGATEGVKIGANNARHAPWRAPLFGICCLLFCLTASSVLCPRHHALAGCHSNNSCNRAGLMLPFTGSACCSLGAVGAMPPKAWV